MAVVSTGQITITDVNDYTYQGTTAPKNPIPNVTIWIDTSVSPSVMKRWAGTAWEIVNEVVVGGKNLLVGSEYFKDFNTFGNGSIEPNKTLKIYDSYYGNVRSTQILNITTAGYFTISFTCLEINSSNKFYIQFKNSTTGVGLTAKQIVLGKNVFTQYLPAGNYYMVTFFANAPSFDNTKWCLIKNDIKVEKGNKATDWTPAPEDVDSAILTAQNSANTANNLLADIANDNILTPSEKQSTKKEWDIIVGEKAVVESQASSLGVSTTSYVNAYNSLNSYITPLLANLTVNSTIVGSNFRANFKNYYDAKIALLKAVTDKLKYNTDNIQIGGRNLLLNFNNWVNEGWNILTNYKISIVAGATHGIISNQISDSGEFVLSFDVVELNGVVRVHNSVNFDQPVTLGKNIFYLNAANQKIVFYGNGGSAVIQNAKLERGNKATDWTPAPEDIQLQIDLEAAKVINLENKTDFLTGTTIEGNAVATGTLLVGNSDGTNAGLTGLGNTSDGVYLWGGGTYQQMVQGLAKKEQRRNGIDIWRHPNGQIGFEIGIKDGRLIFNGYHSSGFKLFELDPNRGLVNVAYSQESWTETPLRKLTYSSSTFNESTIASEIEGFLIKESRETYTTPPPYGPDSDLVYFTIYSVTQNAVGYDYDNGTNPANSAYESLKGMKANDNDRNTNVANGWYMSSIGEIYSKSEMSNVPPTYTFQVYVNYYQDGKITQTKVVTVTK